MKGLKKNLFSVLTLGLVFIGAWGAGINCLGYFYRPKKPKLLE